MRWWKAAPGALLEPWAGAVVNSVDAVRAFRAEVPELRLLVDTGHVADWGGDPCELLELADHVQLRQGKPGHTQVHVDDPSGVVDFAAVLRRLERSTTAAASASSTSTSPKTAGPSKTPNPGPDLDLARHRTFESRR